MSNKSSPSLTTVAEEFTPLDFPAAWLGRTVRRRRASQRVKELVSGTRLGHPVHPPLTTLVIGSLTSALLLDLLAPRSGERAARRLIAVGIAAGAPTALSGLSDWADSESADERVRRLGLMHGGANSSAMILYGASLVARRRGARFRAVLLSLAGATMLAGGGYLGGHLSYSLGVGVNQTAFDKVPKEWTRVALADEVPEGQPHPVEADGAHVLLVRRGETLYAINDRCNHRGCRLSSGELSGQTVTCPCHGSQFDIRDGSLLRGPATTRQPVFEARICGDHIEIRPCRQGRGDSAT